MHSIIKSSFYVIFLLLSLVVGIRMLLNSKDNKIVWIFGIILLLLGLGEGFHLVPRIIEIFTNDFENIEEFIDSGRFIASISIVFVYLMLLWFGKAYYKESISKKHDLILYVLAGISVIFSLLFKTTNDTYLILLRNIPMIIIATTIIFHFKKQSFINEDKSLRFLWLALLAGLIFTIGFELLSPSNSLFIILMMPKTLMYIWVILMGYGLLKKESI